VAGFYDVAVRDAVMSLAAFTLARLTEARNDAAAHSDVLNPALLAHCAITE